MADRRVVITGLGLVSALGLDKESCFQAMWDGQVGIERISAFDPSGFPSQLGGEVKGLKPAKIVPKTHRKAVKLMSRDIELAVGAADAAIRDAGLRTKGTAPGDDYDYEPRRTGTNIGAGLICCDLVELAAAAEHAVEDNRFSYTKWGGEGMESLTPLWLLKYLPNMLGCHVSIIHDFQGVNNNITCAEASGLLSIGEAYRTILHHRCEVMVAGSAECKVHGMGLLRQCLLGRVSTSYNDRPDQAYRPFDRDADGTVIGEGGGIVVLEELEHAQKRGATILGEITGFGASSTACNGFVKASSPQGLVIAQKKALAEAQLSPESIDLLVPHGLAIPDQDAVEATAIRTVFGDHCAKLPVWALKGQIGNCGAGASSIDAVMGITAMTQGRIPATANCPNPPSEYGLNLVQSPHERSIRHVMISSYTFGGQSAAITVSQYP